MSPATSQYLKAWFSQKPTFAVMGECSADKSTLLNLSLGRSILPSQVIATSMPIVWMTYAQTPTAYALRRGGVLEQFDIASFGAQSKSNPLLLRLGIPTSILKRIDIIYTPGISDARFPIGALNFLGPYLDFVLWCSAANQAWRQSEKAMFMSLPAGLRYNSILALTRADIITKSVDMAKVLRRCKHDSADLFRYVTPVSATRALLSRDNTGQQPEGTFGGQVRSHCGPRCAGDTA